MKDFTKMIPVLLVIAVAFGIAPQARSQGETADIDLSGVITEPGSYTPGSTDAPMATLFDNGPVFNSAGTGAGGADESIYYQGGTGTYGSGCQYASGIYIADDFTVSSCKTWSVTTIDFYSYQTNSGTSSTITGIYIRIWSGKPGVAGSTIIWGDMTTNFMASTTFANIYRVLAANGGTARPIMKVVANTPGLSLNSGSYWIEWGCTGSAAFSGPWAPPVVTADNVTGNAIQTTDAGVTYTDILYNSYAQGMPFVMYGTETVINPVPTINGANNLCFNTGNYDYTTESGMTNYIWTVSSGGVIINGYGTSQITVSWITSGAQIVSVTYSNAGCQALVPTVLDVTVNDVPATAGSITGTATVCTGTTGVAYSVAPVTGALSYIWNLPAGASIASGAWTNIITVDYAADAISGPITVMGNNLCGNGPASPPFDVIVTPLPDTPGMISGNNDVCVGESSVIYSVNPIADATGYIWTLPAGATIVAGNNTNTITVDFSLTAVSGTITVYGTNTCGNGTTSPPFDVIVNPLPDTPGMISGNTDVCQGVSGVIYSVDPIADATGYVWTLPAGATIVAGNNTNTITVDFSLSAVSGTITVYGTNTCGNGVPGPDFQVTVNPIPPTPIVTVINTKILHSNITTGNQWYFQGTLILGATTQEYTATQNGEYWCVVTWSGCSSDTSHHIRIVLPGIQPEPSSARFVVNPVPNDGQFKASITYPILETFTIKVYNNLGVMIFEIRNIEVNGTAERSIDLRPTPSGIYSVIFENGNNRVIRKILINR